MKRQNLTSIIIFTVILSLIIAGCAAKEDPRALAQETWNLTIQYALDSENESEIQVKLDSITAKVEKMSLKNQLIYAEELARLTSEFFIGIEEIEEMIEEEAEEVNDIVTSPSPRRPPAAAPAVNTTPAPEPEKAPVVQETPQTEAPKTEVKDPFQELNEQADRIRDSINREGGLSNPFDSLGF